MSIIIEIPDLKTAIQLESHDGGWVTATARTQDILALREEIGSLVSQAKNKIVGAAVKGFFPKEPPVEDQITETDGLRLVFGPVNSSVTFRGSIRG